MRYSLFVSLAYIQHERNLCTGQQKFLKYLYVNVSMISKHT